MIKEQGCTVDFRSLSYLKEIQAMKQPDIKQSDHSFKRLY